MQAKFYKQISAPGLNNNNSNDAPNNNNSDDAPNNNTDNADNNKCDSEDNNTLNQHEDDNGMLAKGRSPNQDQAGLTPAVMPISCSYAFFWFNKYVFH